MAQGRTREPQVVERRAKSDAREAAAWRRPITARRDYDSLVKAPLACRPKARLV